MDDQWKTEYEYVNVIQSGNYTYLYSTFQAKPAKTGGLIFVTLISFSKLYFLTAKYVQGNKYLLIRLDTKNKDKEIKLRLQ